MAAIFAPNDLSLSYMQSILFKMQLKVWGVGYGVCESVGGMDGCVWWCVWGVWVCIPRFV